MPEHLESPEQVIQKWLKGEIKSQELFAMSPEAMQALAEHGYMLYEQGKYQAARVVFEGLAAIDNNNHNYHRLLGSIYQIEGLWDAAYYRYTLVLKAVPDDVCTLANRGEVLLRLGKAREAGDDLRQAVSLDPTRTNPSARRARVLLANLGLR